MIKVPVVNVIIERNRSWLFSVSRPSSSDKHGYLISGERIAYMCFEKIEINI